ncbi:hypothetical protein EDB83DRAFT_1782779 [Lactarius deliciosus]|nr:hypothetical protein EDB83DRAFT_1782779 [Lactarius deliciosus]
MVCKITGYCVCCELGCRTHSLVGQRPRIWTPSAQLWLGHCATPLLWQSYAYARCRLSCQRQSSFDWTCLVAALATLSDLSHRSARAAIVKEMDIWYSLRSHFPPLDISLPGYLSTSPRYSPTSPSFSPRYFPQSHVVTTAVLPRQPVPPTSILRHTRVLLHHHPAV